VWVAVWSPLLKIDSIRVVGSKHVSSVDVALVAGLGSGDNLLLLSTEDVERAVETLPWVRRADVERKLPGTVKVRIVERKAALVLSTGHEQWTLDRTGHVLAPGSTTKGLPTLGGVVVGTVSPGMRLTDDAIVAALRTWRSLSHSLRTRLEGIFAPTSQRLTLALSGGVLVRYGSGDEFEAKNEVLKAVLARVARDGRDIAYIDVRVPTSPAVQPVVVAPAPPAPAPAPSSSPSPTPEHDKKPRATP
jgi:cell division protein FtsQ